MERFNQLDWPIQKERIVSFSRRWRGRVILDATGIGDPIYDDLKWVLPDIEPFKLTAASKTELIQRLIVAIEQRPVSWPAAWDVLTAEMKRYEYSIAPAGGISYGAPSGYPPANAGAWRAMAQPSLGRRVQCWNWARTRSGGLGRSNGRDTCRKRAKRAATAGGVHFA